MGVYRSRWPSSSPPPLAEQITPVAAARSLKSVLCPACEGVKESRRTFCRACWKQLPAWLKRSCWHPIGMGYEATVIAAMKALGKRVFHLEETNPQQEDFNG